MLADYPTCRASFGGLAFLFRNWDRWYKEEFFDRRLQSEGIRLCGFEAKSADIGHPGEVVREKCSAIGVACVAIGAGPLEGYYAAAAGAGILTHVLGIRAGKSVGSMAGEHGSARRDHRVSRL